MVFLAPEDGKYASNSIGFYPSGSRITRTLFNCLDKGDPRTFTSLADSIRGAVTVLKVVILIKSEFFR